ncbi:MAG: AbrB/MazE/SpoVT family DNA-binding domain-containing protein [Pyrinomonadaceae bacterium]|jgi:antitoxin MazE
MKAKIQKWGNSLAVRIPKSFAIQTKIEQDSTVDLTIIGDKIIVEPEKKKPRFTLDELLSEISEENIHSETDWGEPVGREIL